MNRTQQIKQWLGNRQRKYADGVAIFMAVARKVQLEKYAKYFAEVSSPEIFDHHFTMLVNLLTRIYNDILRQPALYPKASEEVADVKMLQQEEQAKVLKEKDSLISFCEEHIAKLNERLEELGDSGDDNSTEIASIRSEIEAHERQLKDLQAEVAELSKPGVKVITEASMPAAIKTAYARIKEIVPFYASLHAELSNESIADEQRKKYADELCKLDDERRKLWKKIDDWSEGKGTLELDTPRPEYSDNPVVRGYELARAVKRLKQNIANSTTSAQKAKEDGRETVYENAMKRIARYESELAEVEKELSGETAE